MSAECRLTCFDCPALNAINRELGNVQLVRDFAQKSSIEAMNDSEQASRADDIQGPLASTKVTCENIFTLLDQSEAILEQSRTELAEACAAGEPYITSDPALLGRHVLRCSSELAVDIAPSISTAILPEG